MFQRFFTYVSIRIYDPIQNIFTVTQCCKQYFNKCTQSIMMGTSCQSSVLNVTYLAQQYN